MNEKKKVILWEKEVVTTKRYMKGNNITKVKFTKNKNK